MPALTAVFDWRVMEIVAVFRLSLVLEEHQKKKRDSEFHTPPRRELSLLGAISCHPKSIFGVLSRYLLDFLFDSHVNRLGRRWTVSE